MTVYSMTTHVWLPKLDRWSSGQLDVAMLAPSRAAFARATGISAGHAKKFASVGAGGEAAAAATANPGVVMVRVGGAFGKPYHTLDAWQR